ncbi:MAG: type II toxin-antitoxin system VapC family toxin [Chthoniobacterales bacterium]
MIVPDINLLIYAYNRRDPHHEPAKSWWEAALNGSTPVGIPWVTSSGFIRIITNRRILTEPLSPYDAVGLVRTWLDQTGVIILQPGPKFAGLFLGYLEKLGTAGNLATDAQLAALAVENQAELQSNDTDFSRFEGLRWRNPLK